MAGTVSRTHFEATVNGIVIFGWGLQRQDDRHWILGGFIQVAASPVSGDIEDLIQSDIDAGNGDAIDHVLVNEKVAACLFCEKRITLNHMTNAVEDDDSVTIPDVTFLGKPYTVKVMDEAALKERFGGREFRMATINAVGEVV